MRELAADEYHAALKLGPRQVGTCINLAIAFYSIKEFRAACQACEHFLKLDPSAVAGQGLLAMSKPMLADLRRRIAHGRAHSPLFDTAHFCRKKRPTRRWSS